VGVDYDERCFENCSIICSGRNSEHQTLNGLCKAAKRRHTYHMLKSRERWYSGYEPEGAAITDNKNKNKHEVKSYSISPAFRQGDIISRRTSNSLPRHKVQLTLGNGDETWKRTQTSVEGDSQ
jgi:hypothetical protein